MAGSRGTGSSRGEDDRDGPPAASGDRERGAAMTAGEDEGPDGRTWKRAYALVLAVLAADVVLLWLMGRVYG
jgi:hypothetical protein